MSILWENAGFMVATQGVGIDFGGDAFGSEMKETYLVRCCNRVRNLN